jgi:hypothetical protein
MKNGKMFLKSISATLITGVFLFLAFGSDESKKSGNSSSESKTEQKASDVCPRCDGRGHIATYGAYGCKNSSHFASGSCGTDSHTGECTSSGSKTCPCCNGSGKNH